MGHDGAGWEIFSIDGNRDLAFVTRLLDQLERTYCIDRARIFSTGFSNGAFFSNILGCTMADRFAAIAPVGGGRLTVPCMPTRAVPVLIHHGRKDARVDVDQARQTRDAWVAEGRLPRTHERHVRVVSRLPRRRRRRVLRGRRRASLAAAGDRTHLGVLQAASAPLFSLSRWERAGVRAVRREDRSCTIY